MVKGLRRVIHKVLDKLKSVPYKIPYRIKLEESDDAIYSASYSGESLTDSFILLRKSLKRENSRHLRRLRPLLTIVTPLAETASFLALLGGIAIVTKIAYRYLHKGNSKSVEDKLEDTWISADGIYFASFGLSNSEVIENTMKTLGIDYEAFSNDCETVGGLTGLLSGPAELVLASLGLKDLSHNISKLKREEKVEGVTDSLSYAGWGLGDLIDGISTVLDILKGISIASLEIVGNFAYSLAGFMDAVLGFLAFKEAVKQHAKRKIIQGIADIVSGIGCTLSIVLPSPINITALVAVGIAELINLISRVRIERIGKQCKV